MIIKNIFTLILVGIILIMTCVLAPCVTRASTNDYQEPGYDPSKMAQRIANVFQNAQTEVTKYLHQIVSPRDLMTASTPAKTNGESLTDVMQSLGVTPNHLCSQVQDIMASQGEKILAIPKQSTLGLLQKGYLPGDILMANIISQETHKSATEVLAMKQINNTWGDIAEQLGVNKETLNKALEEDFIKLMKYILNTWSLSLEVSKHCIQLAYNNANKDICS